MGEGIREVSERGSEGYERGGQRYETGDQRRIRKEGERGMRDRESEREREIAYTKGRVVSKQTLRSSGGREGGRGSSRPNCVAAICSSYA